MNILYVITDLETGGTEQRLLRLLTHLDRNRYHPFVAALAGGPLADSVRALHIPLYDLRLSGRRPVHAMAAMSRIIREHEIDIVHSFLFHANVIGGIAGWLCSRPVLWSVATLEGAAWHHPVYRWLRALPDHVTCSSESVRSFFCARVGMPSARVSVVSHGVAIASSPPPPRSGKDRVIATASRLDEGKGVGDLLKVVARLHRDGCSVTLLVAGDGTQRRTLEDDVRRLDIFDRVRFLGWRADVAEVLSGADLVVHPSRLGEGMPNVVLEAMAAGRAVVATDTGGTREAVEDGVTGFLVRKGDLRDMYDKIKILLDDRDRLRRMGAAGRERAEARFTMKRMVEGYTELYERLR